MSFFVYSLRNHRLVFHFHFEFRFRFRFGFFLLICYLVSYFSLNILAFATVSRCTMLLSLRNRSFVSSLAKVFDESFALLVCATTLYIHIISSLDWSRVNLSCSCFRDGDGVKTHFEFHYSYAMSMCLCALRENLFAGALIVTNVHAVRL